MRMDMGAHNAKKKEIPGKKMENHNYTPFIWTE